MPRWRAWRGSSMLMNEPKNSSASAGMSAIDVEPWPGAEVLRAPADLDDLGVAGHGVEVARASPRHRVGLDRARERAGLAQLGEVRHAVGSSGSRQNSGSAMAQALGAHGRSPSRDRRPPVSRSSSRFAPERVGRGRLAEIVTAVSACPAAMRPPRSWPMQTSDRCDHIDGFQSLDSRSGRSRYRGGGYEIELATVTPGGCRGRRRRLTSRPRRAP